MISLVSTSKTAGEQCKDYQVPVLGKALRGHTYKSAKAGELFRCYVGCERDPACKSCNFKHAQGICEFNNVTKETKANDFITDEQSYYIKRKGRGGYKASGLLDNNITNDQQAIISTLMTTSAYPGAVLSNE